LYQKRFDFLLFFIIIFCRLKNETADKRLFLLKLLSVTSFIRKRLGETAKFKQRDKYGG
jgi:hypothetical protein